MEEIDDSNLSETRNKNKKSSLEEDLTKQASISKSKLEDEEGTTSEGSISEHITSASGSVENDRSLQELEMSNQHKAFVNVPDSKDNISLEQNHDSLDLISFDNIIAKVDDNSDSAPNYSKDGAKNAKSILEEILGNSSHFHSGTDNTDSKDESFNLFANVDLSDKSLINIPDNSNVSTNGKNVYATFDIPLDNEHHYSQNHTDVDGRLKQLEDIVAVKDTTINALTQELDSFREMSNPTFTSSMVSATEYRQLQEDCHNKLMEYNSAIIYKNELIQQLSESLDQSVTERKELLAQVENFKEEVAQLQQKLQETSRMVEDHQCGPLVQKNGHENETGSSSFEACPSNKEDIESLSGPKVASESIEKNYDNEYVLKLQAELVQLRDKIEQDKDDYESEIARLRELLGDMKCGSTELVELKVELEKKHAEEVEELRMYFEKKCAELEKNYSEEVFSQQSRKMSGSSSDVELSADFLLSSQPGPGGDHNHIFKCKEDIEKLKENLTNFMNKLSKHSLEDISEKLLRNIEIEVKNEMNTLFRIGEKLEIKAIENKYLEEVSNLKYQLEEETKRRANISISSAIQEVGSSGDYELNEVVESYERRLQEQVTLAKIDIINALEAQIQRLVSNEADDEEWPSELIQLRDRFTDKYEIEIRNLKEEYETEIAKLKEEHLKILNGALERARRRSLRDGDSLSKAEIELLKERDNLKRQVVSLRNLLAELVKYFTQAEDELNNTLVDNLLKQGNETLTLEQIEEELNMDVSSGGTTNSSKIFDSLANKTRVHLAPNFGDLINMIDHQSQQDDDSIDISLDLKNELGMCLEKLKQEANAVLALTAMPRMGSKPNSPRDSAEEKLSSISKKLMLETQHKERLKQELIDSNEIIASLEKEKECLEVRVDELVEKINILEAELEQAKYKIAELIENRSTEVVSEGYGEEGSPNLSGLGDTMVALSELQEKARTMLAQSRTSADPNALRLIEELCSVGEKIKEEAKKETQDLMRQIQAADKKYKTTQKFLEEQAVEREQERDEAQKKIEELFEQLKERDKDRVNCQIMSTERDLPGQHQMRFSSRKLDVGTYQAEQLEQQIQGLTQRLQDQEVKHKELEDERDEAVEKIKILRDIIKELEQQNDAKDCEIEEHLRNVEKLECIVNQQYQSIDAFKLLKSARDVSDIQNLRRHCEELEKEVQSLRISAELAGSEGALKQLKLQIFEIETSLDKKTKDLELLHSTGTNSCSSPSEEMSVRDLVRPNSSAMDECEVPLQQLARLKEKLLRHSRAEETAIKRIIDLEMQVSGLKTEIEEANNEKEFMKRQIHEQLVLISDFQIRLDQQRIKAEHIEKQTNTSLETKIYDLQNEILDLQEKLRNKDRTINLQEQIIKETQKRLCDVETEIATSKEDELVVEMQKELEQLRHENQILREKSSSENQILPNLVENIIQDKNNDIEKLRNKLNETERLLYTYTSLNLDENDLRTLANLKNSGGSIEQLISILDLSQPIDQMRRYDQNRMDDYSGPNHISVKKSDDTEFLGTSSEPEISSIERVGPSNLHYTVVAPLGKPNSTELIQKSTEKRVHFEDTLNTEKLMKEIEALKKEIEDKNIIILEMDSKIKILNEFEEKITKLQNRLDETEQALTLATKTFEKEQEGAKEREQKLGVELAEKKMHLSEREKEIQALKEDSTRKDEMYFSLAKEKRDLEQNLLTFKRDSFNNLDRAIRGKNEQIENLQIQQVNSMQEIEALKSELEVQKSEVTSLLCKMNSLEADKHTLEEKVASKDNENKKLIKELANKAAAIENALLEVENFRSQIKNKESILKKMQDEIVERDHTIKKLEEEMKKKEALVIDKDCDVEILTEDLKYYQNQILELENKIKCLENPPVDKRIHEEQLKTSELTKELAHLQELIREKDRIIAQMTEDHNQVHSNLKAIDNKIKETGNIFDLSNRLKSEQRKNADLFLEIHKLKAKLLNYEVANAAPVEEITGQLKKELECAAMIDSNILTAVSDHSLSSISEGQDAEVYMKSLIKQKNHNKQLLRANDRLEKEKLSLEQQCNNLQQRLNEMQNAIDKEKMISKQTMIEDAKLIEQLRIKLDGALDYQEQLGRLLEEERHSRRALEVQCEELKKPSSSSESTKYKSLPTQDALELAHLKKELESVKQEKLKLLKENKSLQQSNSELENNVKYTKEMLMLEAERNRAQEEKIRILSEKERSLSEELLRKKFELEVKEREMDEKKIKLDELEQEKNLLKKHKADLVKALKAQTVPPVPSLDDAVVPETLENLIRELKQKSDENKRRLEYIEQIENEKRVLEDQLRNEVRNSVNGNMPFADLVARCNYLFAKALKLESVKKALIWQKRYLVDFLRSHQKHCLIEVLPNQPHENHCLRRRHSPIQHFRAAVYAVISIERMKFLVRRWHSGMRKYEKINSRHYQRSKEKFLQENPGASANFQVGQPVSNQIFSSPYRVNLHSPFHRDPLVTTDDSRPVSPASSGMSGIRDAPWSGNTPPSKDNNRLRSARIGVRTGHKETYTPLRAPQLLNQLHERVEQVQEKLNIPFSADHT